MASADAPTPLLWGVVPMRKEGRPIPRFAWVGESARPAIGTLTVDVERSDIHHRTLKLAKVTDRQNANLLPPLRDVKVVRLSAAYMILTGFETIGNAEVAQSWLCRVAMGDLDSMAKPDEGVGLDHPRVQRTK